MQQHPEPVCLPSIPVARPLVESPAAPQGDGGQVAAQHGDPQLQAELLASLREMAALIDVAGLTLLQYRGALTAYARNAQFAGIQVGACERAKAVILRAEGRL